MQLIALTLAAMLAFAANSLLCRMALTQTSMDAVSFTSLRLLSGAVMLAMLLLLRLRMADPTAATAGNFLRASVLSMGLSGGLLARLHLDAAGVLHAALSGALASGLGYAIWYAVVPRLSVTRAASVQLSVPVLAALMGAWLLDEAITVRLALSAVVILGGIALVVFETRRRQDKPV